MQLQPLSPSRTASDRWLRHGGHSRSKRGQIGLKRGDRIALRSECDPLCSMTAARSSRNSADVEAMRERAPTGMRTEIIHGAVLMAPAPRASHQFAIGRLLAALDRALPLRRGGTGPSGGLFLLGPELRLGQGLDKLNPDSGLDAAGARQIARFGGDDIVCAAPFDEVSVELATLWG